MNEVFTVKDRYGMGIDSDKEVTSVNLEVSKGSALENDLAVLIAMRQVDYFDPVLGYAMQLLRDRAVELTTAERFRVSYSVDGKETSRTVNASTMHRAKRLIAMIYEGEVVDLKILSVEKLNASK